MSKLIALDTLNVACRRQFLYLKPRLDPEIKECTFTGFRLVQTTTAMVGQLYALSNEWYYVNIVVYEEEIAAANHIHALINSRFEAAIDKLNKLAGDSFGRWARQVRKEAGIEPERTV